MATEVRWRRGSKQQHDSFVGAPSEITHNTSTNTLHVHDGAKIGGHPLARVFNSDFTFLDKAEMLSTFVPTDARTATVDERPWRKVLAEPSHLGKAQTADGAWWEVAPSLSGVSIVDFGADLTGGEDSLAAINSAASFASAHNVPLVVPAGTINLSATVTAPGDIEWIVSPDLLITGAGELPAYGGSNSGNRRPSEARRSVVVGTPAAPVTSVKSGFCASLYTAAPAGGGIKGAIVGYAEKHTTIDDAAAVGGFFEADDKVGWVSTGTGSNNFVEGVRAHGVIRNGAQNGSAYGAIVAALTEASVTPKHVVGIEAEVSRNGGVDAPSPNSLSTGTLSAAFLASSGGSKRNNAAFMINPWNSQKFSTGVHIPNGTVTDSAFYTNANVSVAINIDGAPTWAAILLPNASAIRGRGTTPTNQYRIASVSSGNAVVIGDTAATSLVISIPGLGERTVSYGAADSAGVGYRTLRIEN